MPPAGALLCLILAQVFIVFCFRSLVDTVYALKDEVQELRQVSHNQLFNPVTGWEESSG